MKKTILMLVAILLGTLQIFSAAYADENDANLPPIAEDIRKGEIGYKQFVNWYGLKEESSKDTVRVQTILDRLVKVSDNTTLPYEIHVVESEIVNAVCFPGGKIIMFTGIWNDKRGLIKKTDEEIAAIIAHEIAHASKRHWARHTHGREKMRSYEYEIEADSRGMVTLARAGYNPKTIVKIFSRRAVKQHRNADARTRRIERRFKEWKRTFGSHPTSYQRTRVARKNLRKAMKIYRAIKREEKTAKRGEKQSRRTNTDRYANRFAE